MNSLKLTSFLATCVVVFGIPLESPSEDYSKFFGTSRIVGGEIAPENYAPYQAALLYGMDFLSFFMCGGSIVSERYLLTAAHCIDPFISGSSLMSIFHARVGSNIWSQGGTVVRFESYSNHPLWNRTIIKYDVGILVMTTPLVLNERVQPIKLNYNWIDGGVETFIAGWGRTSANGYAPRELYFLDLLTISPEECCERVEERAPGWCSPPLHHAELCTFHSFGHGTCSGDSGSPLVSRKDNRQIGIASWAFPCAIGLPDGFTRLYGMRSFLEPSLNQGS